MILNTMLRNLRDYKNFSLRQSENYKINSFPILVEKFF